MLFRKKGTASAILAIALLAALITSVNSLVNNINSQTPVANELSTIGQTYLITSRSATSLYDSQVNPDVVNQIQDNANVGYATSQQVTQATLVTEAGNYSINLLGVSNLQEYLSQNSASISGSIAQNQSETDIGIILANLASIDVNSSITLALSHRLCQLTVVGITQTSQQSDSEMIMPLATLQALTQNSSGGSYIEFSIKPSAEQNQTVASITCALPSNLKITKVQQVQTFVQNIDGQTVEFINTWSIAVYIVMAAAAYVIAARLLDESKYEFFMLRTLGTKKSSAIKLIFSYTLIVALISSIVGITVGIVGTQIAATGVRWLGGSFSLAPFLQPPQAVEIILLTLAACLIGCVYPAVRTTQKIMSENPQ